MAIRLRGVRAYMRLDVVEHRTVQEAGKTIYEVVLQDRSDTDQVIIRSGWPRVLVEFPVGTDVSVSLDKERPVGVQGPRA